MAGDRLRGRTQQTKEQSGSGSWIDLEQLRRSTQDDQVLQAELLELFRVQARLQLNLISIATRPADYRLAVHTLKGAASAIGARSIAATAAELETLGFPDNAAIRQRLITTLAEQVRATIAEIGEITG